MIFWRDYRNETTLFGGDIYAQKLDPGGNKGMANDGSVILLRGSLKISF